MCTNERSLVYQLKNVASSRAVNESTSLADRTLASIQDTAASVSANRQRR